MGIAKATNSLSCKETTESWKGKKEVTGESLSII